MTKVRLSNLSKIQYHFLVFAISFNKLINPCDGISASEY